MVLRKEFYYGAKYKHNMSTNSILESIELGVTDYARKLHETLTLTDEEERNIVSWKGKVIQLCRENLNRPEVIGRMTLNNKLTATALRELNVLKENFAITEVDKLSHNLALVLKGYTCTTNSTRTFIRTLFSVTIKTSTPNTTTNMLSINLTSMEFRSAQESEISSNHS